MLVSIAIASLSILDRPVDAFLVVHPPLLCFRRDRHPQPSGIKETTFRGARDGTIRSNSNEDVIRRIVEPISRCTRSDIDDPSGTLVAMIRKGMEASNDAKNSISAAEDACLIWESLLDGEPPKQHGLQRQSLVNPPRIFLPPEIVLLCRTFYASCLVRVGRDSDAIQVYNVCLDHQRTNTTSAASLLDNAVATAEHRQHRVMWHLAKAQCLQRLLRYQDALDEYLLVAPDSEQAHVGAVTCALRLGRVSRAREIATSCGHLASGRLPYPSTSTLLAVCLEYLETGNIDQATTQLERLLVPGVIATNVDKKMPSRLLYQWILAALKSRREVQQEEENMTIFEGAGESNSFESLKNRRFLVEPATSDPQQQDALFLNWIHINTSPMDDPVLVVLDDKIELHKLLSRAHGSSRSLSDDFIHDKEGQIEEKSCSFWPEGLILPLELAAMERKYDEEKELYSVKHDPIVDRNRFPLWISKSPAGYGSHGNRILTISEAYTESKSSGGMQSVATDSPNIRDAFESVEERYLLQRIVDPPLLLQGRKFSLRIYIVYFTPTEMYISSEGLVKLASIPFADRIEARDGYPGTVGARMHMTNSGRETSMEQNDLSYLWSEIDMLTRTEDDASNIGPSISAALWGGICKAAREVLGVRYANLVSKSPPGGDQCSLSRQQRREDWGIPKILGLDFVVDGRYKPWLIEVNRFPGLEPRHESDRKVKLQVVGDAWRKAAGRLLGHQVTKDTELLIMDIVKSLPPNSMMNDGKLNASSLKRL